VKRSFLVVIAFALALGLLPVSAPERALADVDSRPLEPQAGSWRTYVLSSGAEIPVPPPPGNGSLATAAELQELLTLQAQRTPAILAAINFWNDSPAFKRWTERELGLISTRGTNTTRAQRNLALVHAAVYDAVIATWHWKYTYHRPDPTKLNDSLLSAVPLPLHPSYPSEHAAIAGAASRVLAHLYPLDAAALEAEEVQAMNSRLQAGTNYRSDVVAGQALGRAVADAVIARRGPAVDGSNLVWDGTGQLTGPPGSGFWERTAPAFAFPPTTPLAGNWRTWVIPSTGAYLSPPPPGFTAGPPASINVSVLLPEAQSVMDQVALTRALDAEGARRRGVIAVWGGVPGNRWNRIALDLMVGEQLNLPRAARVAASVNTAGADAIYVPWKTKYTYWTARPQTIIRQYLDPTGTWLSFRPTPPDPAYSSGLSTVSGAVSEVLAFYFPSAAGAVRAQAFDAMQSRLYDGSHWGFDNQAGYAAGTAMAPQFIGRALNDGAAPTAASSRRRS